MCCFSRAVAHVEGTNIFARALDDVRQVLVYSMTVQANDAIAMILPLPIPRGSGEDAVRFIDLEGYADFFDDVRKGFPMPQAKSFGPVLRGGYQAQTLKVVEVGKFVASFVPSVKDFDRLDARFRMPDGVFDALPAYRDYGFAVFQLNELPSVGVVDRIKRALGASKPSPSEKIHPMAFEFPRRDPSVLFFPTVHVHDGEVHDTAHFDHSLYLQPPEGTPDMKGWWESMDVARTFMDVTRSKNVVDGAQKIRSHGLHGKLKNQDTLVPIGMPSTPLRAVG